MHFDDAKAERAVSFFKQLTHTKGKWAGQRFNLIPWEKEATEKVYGNVRADGNRQYRFVYIEIPKKSGKGDWCAGNALKLLVADDEKAAEVYGAAGDINQASLVFDSAATMVRNSKTLSNRLKLIDSRKRIIDHKLNSVYSVLSAKSETKHGPSPSGIIFDEMHAQKDRKLWDYLTDGTDYAREQQLVIVATTAGEYDPTSIGWEVHEYARQVADGIIEDDEFLPIIYAADQDIHKDSKAKMWEQMEVIRACNPGMGYIFDEKKVLADLQRTRNNPIKLNNFLRFRLNVWVNNVSSYIDMHHWDACDAKPRADKLVGHDCVAAIDCSTREDMTAFVLLFPPEARNKPAYVIPHFYMPKDNLAERAEQDKVPYQMWADAGLITLTDGNSVDYGAMRRDIQKASVKYNIKWLGYDPWGAQQLATELSDDYGLNIIEFRQGLKSMSEPTKEMRNMINSHKIAHGGNAVLNWQANNLTVKQDEHENVKPIKPKRTKRIDGMVCLIMCVGLMNMKAPKSNVIRIDTNAGPMVG